MFNVKQLIQEPQPGKEFDPPMGFGIFDRRLLQPLEWLVVAVLGECDEVVSLEELKEFTAKGWVPLIEGPGLEPGQLGVPLYAPSRVGHLLNLRRAGWSDQELSDVAQREEWYIDAVLTSDEWEYQDDDLELVRIVSRYEVINLECELERDPKFRHRPTEETRMELERHQTILRRFEGADLSALPLSTRNHISMAAFELRFHFEMLRVHLLRWEREEALAGYSPCVSFQRIAHSEEGFDGDVSWRSTLEGLGEDRDRVVIRMPGFRICNGVITSVTTLTPTEYKSQWEKHHFDDYLRIRAALADQRTCLRCHKPLPEAADRRRLYCSLSCQNAAKQKRYRRNNPEAVLKIQQRYWKSLSDD